MSARQSPNRLSLQPLFLCLGLLTLGITACQSAEQVQSPPSPAAVASPAAPTPSPVSVARTPTPPSPDPYELAMDKAVSANSISKSAQSATDWELAAVQWQDAIALMKTVPASSPYQELAKLRVKEFERQLAATQMQVRSFPTTSDPNRVAVIPPLSSGSSTNSPALIQAPAGSSRVYQLPIKRRTGRTPVVAVTFDGKRTYDMIVDTGASSTVITPKMAAELGVVGVDRAIVDTASAKGLEVPVGYVNTIEAGGLLRRQVPVIIATSELEIGLLGHNFFGDYDITIRQDVVEFRAR